MKALLRLMRTAAHLHPSQVGWRVVHAGRLRLDNARPPNTAWAAGEARFVVPPAPGLQEAETGGLLQLARRWREGFVEYLAVRGDRRDWHGLAHPKLWRYQRQYHDELVALAACGTIDEALDLLAGWTCACPYPRGDAWEPYPVARRVLNWALAGHLSPALAPNLAAGLAAQVRFLSRRLERHLLGNHLICDAAALVAGSAAVEALPGLEPIGDAGARLLARELQRQVLPDGGYAERTAQYHAIVLRDVLLALAFSRARGRALDASIERAARAMSAWLAAVARGDDVPWLNDAAPGSAPPVSDVLSLARALGLIDGPWDSWLGRAFGLEPAPRERHARGDLELPDTGWSLVREGRHELLFEHGPIGPDEQPGHGHSDALSYELIWDGHPIVTDTGVTTYEVGPERDYERSARAHATVTVSGQGPDELWAAFRVGARGRVRASMRSRPGSEERIFEGEVRAPAGWVHHRILSFVPGEGLVVDDRVDGARGEICSRLPLSPDCTVDGESLRFPGGTLQFRLARGTRAESEGWVGEGFGRRRPRKVIEVKADASGRMAYALLRPGGAIAIHGPRLPGIVDDP